METPGGEVDDEVSRLRAQLEAAVGRQYRIVRLLGRGGMGAVFLAREESLDRLVAIKVLPEGSGDEETRERFRREARIAAQLNQPNVVPLLGFGDVSRTLYLVMGYVNGESLGARLRRDGRLGTDDARRVLADIADALDYAHRRGVIHRDIKPDNILIDDESGRALLADFGIARGTDQGGTVTRVGDVVGTPQYMSPEQARGGDLDGRSDLYSLGAVGFAMLSGRAPFVGGTTQEVFLRRLSENAPPLLGVSPGASPELAGIIDRLLAREPSERFADARALRLAVAPAALDNEELPEPLDVLDGRGTSLALLTAFALAVTVGTLNDAILEIKFHAKHDQSLIGGVIDGMLQPAMLGPAMVWALIALRMQLPLAAVRAARKRGFLPKEIRFAAFRQPQNWRFFWYPPRFRRRDDVWRRLPVPFRRVRGFATLALVALFFGFLSSVVLIFGEHFGPTIAERGFLGPPDLVRFAQRAFVNWVRLVVGTMLVSLIAAAISLFQAYRFMRTRGFDQFQLHRASSALLYAPTANRAVWRQPDLAAILALSGDAAQKPPSTPGEYPTVLSKIANGVSGEHRDAADAAAQGARRLAEEIAQVDRSLPSLERDADPKEAQRIDARLAGFVADSDDRRELLTVLQKEREIARRSAQRLADAQAARARNLDTLNALWSAANLLKTTPEKAVSQIRHALRSSDEGTATVAAAVDVDAPTRNQTLN